MIKGIRIAVPPLSTQLSIVDQFQDIESRVDSLLNSQSKVSAELNAMLPSILDRAFKGEL